MSDIGAEQNHLCPTISYSAPAPPPFSGARDGRVGAHVRAALLLGHRHARDRAALLAGGDQARVIAGGHQQRLPLGRQLGLGAQRGDDGEGHRDRAAEAGLGLHRGHVEGGAGGVRRGLARSSTAASAARCSTPICISLMPGRVELDLVDAVPVAVERVQDGLVLVGLAAPLLLGLAADQAAERGCALAHPAGALSLGRLDEREVAREHVDALAAAAPG